MRNNEFITTAILSLAIVAPSFADIYQYEDCDGNGTLLLTELNAEPGVSLSGMYLGCADLFSADLDNANLTDADLRNADLSEANLNFALFINANLPEADLTDADLRNADLSEANLNFANFINANLSNANLAGAKLTFAKFQTANLQGTNLGGALDWATVTWTNATWSQSTIFPTGMNPNNYAMIYVPLASGSCCVTSGCSLIVESNCTDMGGSWTEGGSCDDCSPTCNGDMNADGEVDIEDLLLMIGAWGVCP